MRALSVVAGIIEDARGNILLGQRSAHKAEPLKWEFPGGKVNPGETLIQALARELREELAADFEVQKRFATVCWRHAPRPLNLHAFHCRTNDPLTYSNAHSQLAWFPPDRLVKADVPAPDRPLVARLALPATYFITPAPHSSAQRYVDNIGRSLDRHAPGAVLVRLPGIADADLILLASRLLKRIRAHGNVLALLHDQPLLSAKLGFDGVHLSSRRLMSVQARPTALDHWLFASCHNAVEIQKAQLFGVDAAVYGPVRSTTSHPGRDGIGWLALAKQAQATWMPLYALGGVGPSDLALARTHGAHGIAGISAFDAPAP